MRQRQDDDEEDPFNPQSGRKDDVVLNDDDQQQQDAVAADDDEESSSQVNSDSDDDFQNAAEGKLTRKQKQQQKKKETSTVKDLLKGDTSSDDDEAGSSSLLEQERRIAAAKLTADATTTFAHWKQRLVILSCLKSPNDTPESVLSKSKQQSEKDKLSSAVIEIDTESLSLVQYSAGVETAADRSSGKKNNNEQHQQQQRQTPIAKTCRDELLSQLFGALAKIKSLESSSLSSPPALFLLLWSESPPTLSLEQLAVPRSMDAAKQRALVFGPVTATEINTWASRGFFEKKAAQILCVVGSGGGGTWQAVPKKTCSRVVDETTGVMV